MRTRHLTKTQYIQWMRITDLFTFSLHQGKRRRKDQQLVGGALLTSPTFRPISRTLPILSTPRRLKTLFKASKEELVQSLINGIF